MQKSSYSIILPVRNGGYHFKECVSSILQQDLGSFELLILDNCSTDGSIEWVTSLADPRIAVFPTNRPLSIEENWARIVDIPKSEFITLIGHDDLLDRNYLAGMEKLIQAHPGASLYQAHFRYINPEGKQTGKCRPMEEKQEKDAFLHSLLTDTIDTMGTGYMMRARDYDRLGGIPFYPNLLFADHALWLELTAISYKATTSAELFSYRRHQSTSKGASAVSYINAFYRFMSYLEQLSRSDEKIKAVMSTDIQAYIMYYCRSLSHRLLKTPVRQRQGMTVAGFIAACADYARRLGDGRFEPYRQRSVRLAAAIDSNFITRSLYLAFRKVYQRPVYTKTLSD